jgi:hypothetical protein
MHAESVCTVPDSYVPDRDTVAEEADGESVERDGDSVFLDRYPGSPSLHAHLGVSTNMQGAQQARAVPYAAELPIVDLASQ